MENLQAWSHTDSSFLSASRLYQRPPDGPTGTRWKASALWRLRIKTIALNATTTGSRAALTGRGTYKPAHTAKRPCATICIPSLQRRTGSDAVEVDERIPKRLPLPDFAVYPGFDGRF